MGPWREPGKRRWGGADRVEIRAAPEGRNEVSGVGSAMTRRPGW
jgi:hypothetical protein